MKFITEEDLRDLYRKEPFTDYNLQPGERLTPGARQFLVDRGIDMYDRNDNFTAGAVFGKKTEKKSIPSDEKKKKKLHGRMKSLQMLFLLTAEELLHRDICLSQQLTELYRQLIVIGKAAEGMCEASDLCCNPCSGINCDNFSEELGDCFEITDFHMQTENGKEILHLARLRNETEEFKQDLENYLEDEETQSKIEGFLNQIINILSQMICGALGGKECQRNI